MTSSSYSYYDHQVINMWNTKIKSLHHSVAKIYQDTQWGHKHKQEQEQKQISLSIERKTFIQYLDHASCPGYIITNNYKCRCLCPCHSYSGL